MPTSQVVPRPRTPGGRAVRALAAAAVLLLALWRPAAAQWHPDDFRTLDETVRWARDAHLDTLPAGALVARIGERFVGAPYRAGTLETGAPERLVVNLREFDCVTFVESVLALARFVAVDGTAPLADTAAAEARFEGYLRELRYRGGRIDGYASRFHYFSEWLAAGAAAGRLELVTERLGGEADPEPIDFMSAHAAAYPALADPATLAAIRGVEAALAAGPPRIVLPKARVAGAEAALRDGDVVAATAARPGLDVVHTGFVVLRDGRAHLLHAPLAGGTIEVSALPLAERLQGIAAQDGLMVARAGPAWLPRLAAR
jgi:hypothetical protein